MKDIKQKAVELALAVYGVTNLFPGGEVLNCFRIARAQSWIKSINFVVLTREYQRLAEEIKLLGSEKSAVPKPTAKVNSLNKRQEKILSYVKDKDFVQLKELSVLFPSSSPRTIRKDLNEMAKRKILFQQGRGRSSFYKINPAPFRGIRPH